MIRITQVIGISILFLVIGCATARLPQGARVVGGGLQIDYLAPEAGTVILVEKTTGKTVATKSVAEGDTDARFTFNAALATDLDVLEAVFTSVPTNALFVLYFVPARKSR